MVASLTRLAFRQHETKQEAQLWFGGGRRGSACPGILSGKDTAVQWRGTQEGHKEARQGRALWRGELTQGPSEAAEGCWLASSVHWRVCNPDGFSL